MLIFWRKPFRKGTSIDTFLTTRN